ncbi:diguanylate cyclase domain-containing protein [Streptomyces lavendulocolor]|uniref:diguanylate cyclase domain-containing protein n=1 Tax=Streptomyces lavendulocolor TaxID=67316 RepID=UPI003C2D66D3
MNDTLGHAVGDTILATYGVRLTAWMGPRAALGRLGGEESQSSWTCPPTAKGVCAC